MVQWTAKIKEELVAMIPPTIYFFVALHLVALVRHLMLERTGLSPASTMSIAVAALVLGKAVLIADMLPFVNRFADKPLAHNVAWKSVLYLLVSAAIHYLERLFDFAKAAGDVAAGNARLMSEIIWPHFWAVQIFLFVLILVYCTLHELTRLIGKDKMWRIFFGPTPAPAV